MQEQQLYRNVQRFRGRLVFKAHKLLYHSTLGLRVMKKKIKTLHLTLYTLHPTGQRAGDRVRVDREEPHEKQRFPVTLQ